MLPDIFSAFDPGTNSIFLNFSSKSFWAIQMMILMSIQSNIWMSQPRQMTLINLPISVMYEQMTRTLGKNLKTMSHLVTALILMIILTNFMGLMPYVFSLSSHLIFSFTIGLPLWFALIMSSINMNVKMFMAHLVPSSAPNLLAPALALIESTSTLVRPFTLSFRLAANMSAGHIVLTLMGSYLSGSMFSSITSTIMLLFLQTGYILFEIGICLVQAYIFCLLLSLYSDEHPLEKLSLSKAS